MQMFDKKRQVSEEVVSKEVVSEEMKKMYEAFDWYEKTAFSSVPSYSQKPSFEDFTFIVGALIHDTNPDNLIARLKLENLESINEEVLWPIIRNAGLVAPNIFSQILKNNFGNLCHLNFIEGGGLQFFFYDLCNLPDRINETSLSAMQKIVEFGADINKQNFVFPSCLSYAVSRPMPDRVSIETLFRLGANPNLKDSTMTLCDEEDTCSPKQYCERNYDTHGWVLEIFDNKAQLSQVLDEQENLKRTPGFGRGK